MSKFYEFTGKVVSVGKTESLGKDPSKPFKKRLIIVDDSGEDDKYPNPVPFEATADKCGLLDSCKKGDEVTIKFAINGREWTDRQGQKRYFGSNRILTITKGDAKKEVDIPMKGVEDVAGFDDDDIPF